MEKALSRVLLKGKCEYQISVRSLDSVSEVPGVHFAEVMMDPGSYPSSNLSGVSFHLDHIRHYITTAGYLTLMSLDLLFECDVQSGRLWQGCASRAK